MRQLKNKLDLEADEIKELVKDMRESVSEISEINEMFIQFYSKDVDNQDLESIPALLRPVIGLDNLASFSSFSLNNSLYVSYLSREFTNSII